MDSVRVKLKISPLTPELWPAFEALFGKAGACNGCWCLYWRIGSEYHKRPRERNRVAFKRIVERGPPPGLIAFDGETAVGWCQLTARDDLRWLQSARFFERVDDAAVWSISCFYVRRDYRNRGVMSALIAAAVKEATRAKVRVLEAYPVDTDRPDSTRNVFTGTRLAFERCGFQTVARRVVSRPIMRRELRSRDS
jgi:GNAT superfamily N-acetyltransferase